MKSFKGFTPSFFKTFDDHKIWYAKNFQGQPNQPILVFNYGLVCTNQHWQYQINYLNKKDFPILIQDLRGHYTKENIPISSITIHNFVQDLKQLLDLIKIKRTYMLGHSMGVNTTLEFTLQYPKMVEKIILITGTILPVDSILLRTNLFENVTPLFDLFSKKSPYLLKTLWKPILNNYASKKLVAYLGFNQERTSKEFIDEYMQNISELPVELVFQLLNEMSQHHLLPHLDLIQQKTLIIKGSKDRVIPPQIQDLIHNEIKNSEIFEIEYGSHVPQVDFPKKINNRILSFLKS